MKYASDDGKIFDTEAECKAYEAQMSEFEKVREWAEKRYPGKGMATKAYNVVTDWLSDHGK